MILTAILTILLIILIVEFVILIGTDIYHNIQTEKREADLHNLKYHHFD